MKKLKFNLIPFESMLKFSKILGLYRFFLRFLRSTQTSIKFIYLFLFHKSPPFPTQTISIQRLLKSSLAPKLSRLARKFKAFARLQQRRRTILFQSHTVQLLYSVESSLTLTDSVAPTKKPHAWAEIEPARQNRANSRNRSIVW